MPPAVVREGLRAFAWWRGGALVAVVVGGSRRLQEFAIESGDGHCMLD
jgi:hypothetical protein